MTAPVRPIPPGLRWAIKRSFIEYVRRMPDGRGTITDGARPLDSDRILFDPDHSVPVPESAAGVDRFWAFRGDVRFKGHCGMLFVRVSAPWLTLRGKVAELSIEDPYGAPDAVRISLVTLVLEQGPAPDDGIEVWYGSDVRLTAAGTELFGDAYQPGEPFEPLTIVAPAVGRSD